MANYYDEEKQIEVTYIWGDPTGAFLLGCRLAQEAYSKRGLDVFKTCSNEGNFMKGYNGEECIFLTGLIGKDMSVREFAKFINGKTESRFENVNLGNVRVIIITAREMPIDLKFRDEADRWNMLFCYSDINHLYEVCSDDTLRRKVLEYEVEEGWSPRHAIVHEGVNLDDYSLLRKEGRGEYFERLPIWNLINGDDTEKKNLINELGHLSNYEKRKLCAILEAHYAPVPCDRVRKFAQKLDDFYYLPYIHNYRDLGCYYIFDVTKDKSIMEHSMYFDFEALGMDMDYIEPGVDIHMDHVTRYGYICGIDPMGYYPNFDRH